MPNDATNILKQSLKFMNTSSSWFICSILYSVSEKGDFKQKINDAVLEGQQNPKWPNWVTLVYFSTTK